MQSAISKQLRREPERWYKLLWATTAAVYVLIVTGVLGLFFQVDVFNGSVYLVFLMVYCEGGIGVW